MEQFNGLAPQKWLMGYTVDHENRIYLGSYYHAHLLRFDPKTEEWEDLGRPGGESNPSSVKLQQEEMEKFGRDISFGKLFSFDPRQG